jgi:ribosome-associated protein
VIPDLDSLERRERNRSNASALELALIQEHALVAARAAVEVKADDVKILAMHGLVTYTDFLVLCTGRNSRLTRRIAEEVAHQLKARGGLIPIGTEGSSAGEWILLDYLDFMLHVFTPEAREFYRLDVLWKQAPVEEIT